MATRRAALTRGRVPRAPGGLEQLAEAYEGYGALNACLASGGAALVHAQWLVDYAASRLGHSLPKRQDLPAMAVDDGPLFELTTVLVVLPAGPRSRSPIWAGNSSRKSRSFVVGS